MGGGYTRVSGEDIHVAGEAISMALASINSRIKVTQLDAWSNQAERGT